MHEGNPIFPNRIAEHFSDSGIPKILMLQLQDHFSRSHHSEAREVIQSSDNHTSEWIVQSKCVGLLKLVGCKGL
jgi:hypothetical protein